ncbi:MAG: leucine--tRNA ligase [Candidatus Magasanikbacteria bacterium]|nr:leucine--tRNA ligase [Candidatus Magasanikbacteria bacterium]
MQTPYNPKDIEKKWQDYWKEQETFVVKEDAQKKKFYGLVEFPYPSGSGLHVGHPRSYTAMDIICRKRRMQGYNVLFPMGFDAFGLPTENYAIKTGRPPAEVTKENIENFTRQLQLLGYSFDWSRTVDTTDPQYYKWTQWIFLQLFERGLAYKKNKPINWCIRCKIGLANEEIVGGNCERCGGEVEKRDKEQWMLAITKYADSLLEGLKEVDYIKRAKVQQEHWIGRKEGVNITYKVEGSEENVVCFTTRPDTNFGATFVVVGPEHPLVSTITKSDKKKEVDEYVKKAKLTKEIERTAEDKEKTGVFTGSYCINSLNNKKIPIWVADYVLGNVGTGAVVGVPGHDKRDFAFAKAKDIDIIRVVVDKNGDTTPITKIEQVQEESGTMINSGFLNGLDIHEATQKIMDYIEEKGWGKKVINYKLRDWVFSRQRYWGEPIPLIHCVDCGWVPVPEDQLPVKLPHVEKYEPTDTGESPLAAMSDWVNTTCPTCAGPAKRETDTMPNWAGSSWYFLRYCDPNNNNELASRESLTYWSPVDWYNGGMEHTVLHLLYSRFWHQFLFDIDLVPTKEPYKKRTSHGMILAKGGEKMSKSKGNVVNPDDIIHEFGADTLRTYIMFMGPFDQVAEWDTNGLVGVKRFLDRIWLLQTKVSDSTPENPEAQSALHKTIKKVSEDIESMSFNTAVAKMMELSHTFQKLDTIPKRYFEKFILLLSPFAPHISEQMWQNLGNINTIVYESWPAYKEEYLQEEEVTIAIQVNGKLRATITVNADSSEEDITAAAKTDAHIVPWLAEKVIKKVIYVPGKLVNIVA